MDIPDPDAVLARLDAYAAGRLRLGRHPGMAVAVTGRDALLWTGLYGFANLDARRPVRAEHLFEIGSISKSFTALIALQEHEAGRLDLHAPITEYLPWFRLKTSLGPITAHHLLTHTAGLPVGSNAAPATSPEGLVRVLSGCPAAWPPGERFSYSNAGYQALGLVLERVTRRPFPALLTERLLEPLGMRDSVPAITHDVRPRLAEGYAPRFDDRPAPAGRPLVVAPWVESVTADGSIATTPADLAAYLRLILNRGRGPAGPLVSEASFALWAGDTVEAWPGSRYGYGLAWWDLDGRPVLGHAGDMLGFTACALVDLTAGVGALVMVNGPDAPRAVVEQALRLLRAALAGAPLPSPPPAGTPAGTPTETPAGTPGDSRGDPAAEPDDEAPAGWAACAGHYRSHNPWQPTLRVRLVGKRLWALGGPLEPLPDGSFRPEAAPAERLRFDWLEDGLALRASLSGCDYYRDGPTAPGLNGG